MCFVSVFMNYFDNPGGMIPAWLVNWAAKVSAGFRSPAEPLGNVNTSKTSLKPARLASNVGRREPTGIKCSL